MAGSSDSDNIDELLKVLCRPLDRELRQIVARSTHHMGRDLRYLLRTRDKHIVGVMAHGWSLEELEVLCALSAFYQLVIGPLAGSARRKVPAGVGESIPLLYGQRLVFDDSRSQKVRAVEAAFLGSMDRLKLRHHWLLSARASDLVFRMQKDLEAESSAR